MWFKKFRRRLPLELKRPESAISVGFLAAFGAWLFSKFIGLIALVTPYFSIAYNWASSINIQVSLANLILYTVGFVIIFSLLYPYIDKNLLRKIKGEVIFNDNFEDNKGWGFNYWGTTNPSKTNRIENSMMVFEAEEDELLNESKNFGAYIDIRNGIYQGYVYEISCYVKSDPGTTMKFQLWVHDTVGGKEEASVREPKELITPSEDFEEYKIRYTARPTNAIRIHLHNRGGKGRILVKNVRVIKI